MMRIRSIGVKFSLYITIILCVLFVFSYIIINTFTFAFLDNSENSSFLRWGRDYESLMEPHFIYYSYMNLYSQVEETLKQRPQDFMVLYDARKSEILHRGVSPTPAFREILSDKAMIHPADTLPAFKDTHRVLTIPVLAPNSKTVFGYILYGRSQSDFQNVLRTIRTHHIIMMAVLFALSSLILYFMVRRTVRPIHVLTKGMEMVGKGNMDFRIQVDTQDEFAFLAKEYNEMVARLQSTLEALEANQQKLTHQISERTQSLDQANRKLQHAMEELKATQKKIIQSEKQKSLTAIVAGFAHEINNPLTGILGYIDLMELREDISPYVRNKLNQIKTQTTRIQNIIRELNQLNPDAQQTKLEINLANLLEKLVKIISQKPGTGNVELVRHIPTETVTVVGNHFSLWQIFEGMIENAIESIQEKRKGQGRVTISLSPSVDQSQAVVEIQDNGGGFENLDKAFDPFYTTKNRTQKKGIGLSIAYNLIQEHKGNITIRNTEDGASLTVYLPLSEKNPPAIKKD
ncbi:MAG TPA: HAMP domain-containing histidine kinase [Candidatus Aminicenantes bacterium]|nr:HAMP domain-containing histidine kinase [Candidatus Aminicenantes bacterium]